MSSKQRLLLAAHLVKAAAMAEGEDKDWSEKIEDLIGLEPAVGETQFRGDMRDIGGTAGSILGGTAGLGASALILEDMKNTTERINDWNKMKGLLNKLQLTPNHIKQVMREATRTTKPRMMGRLGAGYLGLLGAGYGGVFGGYNLGSRAGQGIADAIEAKNS